MALEADERIIEAALRAGCCKKYRPKLKLQWPPTPATSIQEPPAPGLLPPSRQDGPQIGHGNEKSLPAGPHQASSLEAPKSRPDRTYTVAPRFVLLPLSRQGM